MYFENVKKNFGFGCMRLPMNGNEVDTEQFCRMADSFIAAGFNYFDTAHGYINGKSETAIREAIVKRYKRDEYILTNKLSEPYFKSYEDIFTFFDSQLEATGVEYYDFYLMHALSGDNYRQYQDCHAFEAALELKKQGKIKHIGISFHDKAEMLEKILSDHPETEVVQIQFNYVDYDDAGVQSKAVYDVCRRFGKPVIVMEPVKGGRLTNLPEDAKKVLDGIGGSYASYAIRFAAGFEGIFMVLSGMSDMAQMNDNLAYMKDFKPLDEKERAAVDKVRAILKGMDMIPCTACRYCVEGCPMNIPIPDLFACMNAKKQYNDWNSNFYYEVHTSNAGKASDCVQCGNCEHICPQHLEIRKLLEETAKTFEN